MDIGFVGLGNMGMPMVARLLDAGHRALVYDARFEATQRAVAHGAVGAPSPAQIADDAETVLISLPTPEASMAVVDQVLEGAGINCLIDLSTIGSRAAQRNHRLLSHRNIAMLDCPVSGGVHGAREGTLAMMVSGSHRDLAAQQPILSSLGQAIHVGETPGAAQTMKLVNNMMAATSLAATAEVTVMGVKAGLDATVLIDALNVGSGATHASRDKFPRSVLPRTFDYGFSTALMVKDLRLYLQEAQALGLPTTVASAVIELWETVLRQEGPDSDFTSIVKPLEAAAGVVVDGRKR